MRARIKWLQKMPEKRVPKTCSMTSCLIVRADVCCCCCVNSVHTCAKTSAASAAFFASSADSNLKNTASPPPGDSTMAPDLILSCSGLFSTAICRQSAEKNQPRDLRVAIGNSRRHTGLKSLIPAHILSTLGEAVVPSPTPLGIERETAPRARKSTQGGKSGKCSATGPCACSSRLMKTRTLRQRENPMCQHANGLMRPSQCLY